jgi:hypothetical protein
LTAPYWIGIEARSVVVEMTPTPNWAATEVAIGQATAQAILDQAAQAATQAAVEADRSQAEEVLETAVALATQMAQQPTVAPATPTPTQPAASPTPPGLTATQIVTATVQTTSEVVLRIAVVEDNSACPNCRERAVTALEKAFDEAGIKAEVKGFTGCSPAFLSETWDGVSMDYKLGITNGVDCIAILKFAYDTRKIPQYPDFVGYAGSMWHGEFRRAGITNVCNKPDEECLVETMLELVSLP